MEFRCFVVADTLAAITQYSNLVYLPRVVANKDKILARIRAFFDERVCKQLSPKSETKSGPCCLTISQHARMNPLADPVDGFRLVFVEQAAPLVTRATSWTLASARARLRSCT